MFQVEVVGKLSFEADRKLRGKERKTCFVFEFSTR